MRLKRIGVMETDRHRVRTGVALLVVAAGCLLGSVFAPIPALVIAVGAAIAAALLRQPLGSWWVPVLAISAAAVLLAGGMLVISLDFGVTVA